LDEITAQVLLDFLQNGDRDLQFEWKSHH